MPFTDELGTSSPDVVSDPAPHRENRTRRSQASEHAAGPTVDPVGLGVRCLGARMRVGVPPLRSRVHWPQGQSSSTILLRVRQREAFWAAAASDSRPGSAMARESLRSGLDTKRQSRARVKDDDAKHAFVDEQQTSHMTPIETSITIVRPADVLTQPSQRFQVTSARRSWATRTPWPRSPTSPTRRRSMCSARFTSSSTARRMLPTAGARNRQAARRGRQDLRWAGLARAPCDPYGDRARPAVPRRRRERDDLAHVRYRCRRPWFPSSGPPRRGCRRRPPTGGPRRGSRVWRPAARSRRAGRPLIAHTLLDRRRPWAGARAGRLA